MIKPSWVADTNIRPRLPEASGLPIVPKEKLKVLLKWNHLTGYGDTRGCKEGKFRNCDLGGRYCTTQFVWCPLKHSLWGHSREKIKVERLEVLWEQERMNHWSVMRGAEHIPKCSFLGMVRANDSRAPVGQASLQNGLCTPRGTSTPCWALLGWSANGPFQQLQEQRKLVEIKKMYVFQRNWFLQWLSSLKNLEIPFCQ